MGVSVRIDGPVGVSMDAAAKSVSPSSARGVLKAASFAGGEIASVVISKFRGGTGDLARSFLPAKFVESEEGVAAGALSDRKHARILDQGGTILPKTAKMLAWPISTEAKSKWPRDWPRSALVLVSDRKAGPPLLIAANSKKLIVHYVLLPRLTVRGRHYLDEARDNSQQEVEEILAEELEKGIDEAFEDNNG